MELTRKQASKITEFIKTEAKDLKIEQQYELADKICVYLEDEILKDNLVTQIPIGDVLSPQITPKKVKPKPRLNCEGLNRPVGR